MEWVYDNDYDSFSLEIGGYLGSRTILLADVTEATFMVKVNREDPDADALATLTLGDGLTKQAGAALIDDALKARFRAVDFGPDAMQVGKNYYIGLGIKTVSMAKFLEIKPVHYRLTVLPDFIHD